MTERFYAVVIGGGMSGLPLALRAAKHGRVALVEHELLGGTCLNRGCIPTKTMIASADVAHSARSAARFGVHVSEPTVDLGAVVDRKNGIVESIRNGSYRAVEGRSQLELIEGEGRFITGRRLQVGDTIIEADRIFLNTGTRDSTGGIDGLDTVPYLTSRTILDLRQLPEHLVVVGGGFIGCEFAQMFRRFGSQVTVVQRADRLIPDEDPDISAAVLQGFEADGINVVTATSCTHVTGTEGAIHVGCEGDHTADIVGTHLLVATGRVPNSDTLGLDYLGIEPNRAGFLDRSIAERVVPHAVFVDPEVGSVGLTEQQARDAGYDVGIGTQAFNGVAKARAMGQTTGLIKFIVDHATDLILGCHIAGCTDSVAAWPVVPAATGEKFAARGNHHYSPFTQLRTTQDITDAWGHPKNTVDSVFVLRHA